MSHQKQRGLGGGDLQYKIVLFLGVWLSNKSSRGTIWYSVGGSRVSLTLAVYSGGSSFCGDGHGSGISDQAVVSFELFSPEPEALFGPPVSYNL